MTISPPASDGNSAVISYTVTAADSTTPANGGETASGSGSPITVTGLANGDTYTFTVTATSAPSRGRIRDRNYGPERFRPTTWRDSFTFAGRWSRSDSIETSLVGLD